jgi:CRISPR-associated protein Cas1
MILEISSHGSVLKRQNDLFVVKNQDGTSEIPAEKVDAIMVSANILISSQAVKLCIEKNIQLVVADWTGRPMARLWTSTAGKSTELRRKQYVNQESQMAIQIAIELVRAKLKGQREFLLDLKNNRKTEVPEITRAIAVISEALLQVGKLAIDEKTKQTLLGFEGTSASAYFRAISAVLPDKWSFERRSQYPALDGFNALLNYAYGIAYSDVEKIIILSGLDPNAGFYHADSYGKPTLSFDLMEPVRPLVDRTVASLFNKKMVSESWFEDRDGQGIFLAKEARLALLTSYGEKNRKELEKIAWGYCRKIIEQLAKEDKAE